MNATQTILNTTSAIIGNEDMYVKEYISVLEAFKKYGKDSDQYQEANKAYNLLVMDGIAANKVPHDPEFAELAKLIIHILATHKD